MMRRPGRHCRAGQRYYRPAGAHLLLMWRNIKLKQQQHRSGAFKWALRAT